VVKGVLILTSPGNGNLSGQLIGELTNPSAEKLFINPSYPNGVEGLVPGPYPREFLTYLDIPMSA